MRTLILVTLFISTAPAFAATAEKNLVSHHVRNMIKPARSLSEFVKNLPMTQEHRADILRYLIDHKLDKNMVEVPKILPNGDLKFRGDNVAFQVVGDHKIRIGKKELTLAEDMKFSEIMAKVQSAQKVASFDILDWLLPQAVAQIFPTTEIGFAPTPFLPPPSGFYAGAVGSSQVHRNVIKVSGGGAAKSEAKNLGEDLALNDKLEAFECNGKHPATLAYRIGEHSVIEWKYTFSDNGEPDGSDMCLRAEKMKPSCVHYTVVPESTCAKKTAETDDEEDTPCHCPLMCRFDKSFNKRLLIYGEGEINDEARCCELGRECSEIVKKAAAENRRAHAPGAKPKGIPATLPADQNSEVFR